MAEGEPDFGTTMIPGESSAAAEPPRRLPVMTILAHPQLSRIGDMTFLRRLAGGGVIEVSRHEPHFHNPRKVLGTGLKDPYISRKPFLLKPLKSGDLCLARHGTRTEIQVGTKSLDRELVITREELARGVPLMLGRRVLLLLHECMPSTEGCNDDFGMIGYSDAVRFLRQEIRRVADLETPVLLHGPSGSGKELAARAIHQLGAVDKPLVSVNMGAIPASLAASELFGSVKGAFTGSQGNQTGYFRAAAGGMLFLDEIGETPAEIQVMLLRSLETGEIFPVGSQKPVPVKTRLIAATDADLSTMIEDRSFKSPLFHRLAGYEIELPGLFQRREDLGRLFMHFAAKEMVAVGLNPADFEDPDANPWMPPELMLRLLNFSWPGNVRQLHNVVRQLVIGCRDQERLQATPKVDQLLSEPGELETKPVSKRKPAEISAEELTSVLEENRWDIKATAQNLGISRGSLYLRIQKTPGLVLASDLTLEDIEQAIDASQGDWDQAAMDLKVSAPALRRRAKELDLT